MKIFNDTYMFYSNMDTVIRMPERIEAVNTEFDEERACASGRSFMDVLRTFFEKH